MAKRSTRSSTYALLCELSGRVKIGRAINVHRRIRDIQAMNATTLALIGIADRDIELELHTMLSDCNVHGEWFAYNDKVRAAIAERMRPMYMTLVGDSGDRAFVQGEGTGQYGDKKARRCGKCDAPGHHAQRCHAVVRTKVCAGGGCATPVGKRVQFCRDCYNAQTKRHERACTGCGGTFMPTRKDSRLCVQCCPEWRGRTRFDHGSMTSMSRSVVTDT